jgi:flagellin
MPYSINTNIMSLQAQDYLRVTSDFQQKTINRVTSGLRIISSGDDAAGLAIANGFRSDQAVLTQGVRNANDGLSTLQTIDGGITNISKLLDRARTLATQSASGTFTGDRSVLNSEFQSVLSEIDRQARAIGLDAGGQFAKSLSVFIGGGKANGGDTAITNGSVSVNLSTSTVDTKSLGLKGMEVVGGTAGTTDIGTGSATTSVAQILADTNNTTATNGYTDFYFAGPGFSDSSKVKVSVSTQSVSDAATLVTAINAAIQSAGNGGTQAATAFKNANIVASVNTDSTGKQQLAFTSSTTAFQVEAGDRMANALMGNFTDANVNADGAVMSSTVQGFANSAATTTAVTNPTGITVRFMGAGMTSPVNVTLGSGSTTIDTAITDLSSQVANNSTLKAAGITLTDYTAGGKLTFTSARGETFDVQVSGDTANRLGFGSFITGDAGEFDYASRTGAAYADTTADGTAKLGFSINGAASSGNLVTVDLTAGDATAGTAVGNVAGTVADQDTNTLILAVDGGASQTITFAGATTTITDAMTQINTYFTANGIGASASLDSDGYLVITSDTTGAGSSVDITGGTARAALGLSVANNTGTSRGGQSVVDALNAQFAADTEMQAAGLKATWDGGTSKITVASANNTFFRINAGGSDATADLGFGVAGVSFTGNTVSAAANKVADSGGASNSAALAFTAVAYGGDDQTITITANDSSGTMQSKTITLRNDATARSGRTIDEAVSAINTALQQSNNSTLQKIVAVKEDVGGTEKINFLSTLSSFNVSVGTTANGTGVGSQGSTVAASVLAGGSTADINSQGSAQSAVSALATAVVTLGSAQAVVGKGQNQFNYAINLAQTQISNLAAAESRIRDADLASEAANLTKAQILQQAGLAALAQANSAPQAVLVLLRG